MAEEAPQVSFEVPSHHPFRIKHIFFLDVRVARPEKMPEGGVELNLSTEIAIGLPGDDTDHNLSLRIRSADEAELEIEIVTVGVFEFLDDGKPDEDQLTRFINEHLLIAMTTRAIQLIATLSGQMGMPPVWLPTPRGFGLEVATVKQLIQNVQTELDF